MTLSVSDRIVWQGKKAVVKRLWKNKVKIILSDLSEQTVAIKEVEPWIDAVNGQLSLIDVSQFEDKRDFRDWELENQDAIPDPNPDPNLDPNPDPNLDPNFSDPNPDPNPDPNLDPNFSDPNPDPNPDPNLDPRGYLEIKKIKGNEVAPQNWTVV